jgi:hypothetical protein
MAFLSGSALPVLSQTPDRGLGQRENQRAQVKDNNALMKNLPQTQIIISS